MKDLIFIPIKIDIPKIDIEISRESVNTFGGLWETKFLKEELEADCFKTIISQLPFEKITMAKYNRQAKDVPQHIDVQPHYVNSKEEYLHIRDNEPAGYRIVLEGSNDKVEVFDGVGWQRALLPETPFAYLLNSTSTLHRVIGETGRKTLYFRGFLDPEKHKQIIEQNIREYKDYAIYSQV